MSLSDREEAVFAGTDRFEVRRRLGEGAFGVVYEAFDRERNGAVALKVLRRARGDFLIRFKGEFRALADIANPNLVSLYELFCDHDSWFFTMELVEGCEFLQHIAVDSADATIDDAAPTEIIPRGGTVRGSGESPTRPSQPREPFAPHFGRLRYVLPQLARGLQALHDVGKLHRDIKPANILVSRHGRVVLLDFGLVTERLNAGNDASAPLVGTPAYMSPEQAAGRCLTEASDWYSVGVVLYQALTGRLPHSGKGVRALVDKQSVVPRSPRSLNPDAPDDLAALCEDLLRINPEERPGGAEILRQLALGSRSTGTTARPPRRASETLLGRDAELRVMSAAFDRTLRGSTSVVFLAGASGMGKTTLIHHFVATARASHEDVVVLESRCYERESVPYKAIDHLIDGLSAWLRTLPEGELVTILPPEMGDLARLFPVMSQIEAIVGRSTGVTPDPQESRRRAFGALRHILTRIAVRKVLVLVIDDLQWGDSDSALLLGEVLRPPASPPLMLLVTCRSEEEETSEFLATLRRLLLPHDRVSPFFSATRMCLGPLAPDASLDLARSLISSEGGERFPVADVERIAKIIAEGCGGQPICIVEYGRFLLSRADEARVEMPQSIEALIQRRAARLPEHSLLLLELLAVAAKPVTQEILRSAAGLAEEFPRALALLTASHLARSKGIRFYDEVESYQVQIRSAVLAALDPERRKEHHHRLAVAMRSVRTQDAETLASHFAGAGDMENAREYTIMAADQARHALAFDRAARLYRRAIDLKPPRDTARELVVHLGESLAGAGRGAEAALVYLGAVEGARVADSIELQRRAAEQLLQNGHMDDGLVTLKQVLARLGMKLADSPLHALASLLLRRIMVRLRGLAFEERDSTQLSQQELTKIDACWSASVGLGLIDTIRGADFQARHLLLALDAGEPFRVARALATEAGYSAAAGTRARERTSRLLELSRKLAKKIENPHAEGLTLLIEGMAATLEGKWRESLAPSRAAEALLRERCSGVFWERFMSQLYPLISLMWLGEWKEISTRVPALLAEVRQRGDFFAETYIRTRLEWIVALAGDDPREARAIVDDAIGRWSSQGFHLQHFQYMLSRVEIGLYTGDVAEAYAEYRRRLLALNRSMLTRAQIVSIEVNHMSARAKLALRAAGADGAPSLASVMRDVARIERNDAPWGNALALAIRAGAASLRDDRAVTVALLEQAESALEKSGMAMCSAVARRRRGQMLGDETLVRAADARMSANGVARPDRIADVVLPGRWG
ncbi:MAG: serine/threonine-protein kinase [Thermoanaerobaculia bacterium]